MQRFQNKQTSLAKTDILIRRSAQHFFSTKTSCASSRIHVSTIACNINLVENSKRLLSVPCDSCYIMCISYLVQRLDVTVLVSHRYPCSLKRLACLSSSLLHFSPPLIRHLLFSCSY